jgi:hypothetical protein
MKLIVQRSVLSFLLVFAAACGTDGMGGGMSGETRTLTPTFTGLMPLGSAFVYEGWLIVDGMPVSAGRFTIGDDGTPTPSSFDLDAAAVEGATKYVLTIEPATGDDPAPSATHVLAGDLSNGTAMLSVADPAALGTDFSDAMGAYILKTPSSASDMDDTQGIWFLDPSGGPAASLALPSLPEGWVYEGWIVGSDGPVSTGRFLSAAEMDSDGLGPDAGTDGCSLADACPPFPGQDFIMPARDLIGTTVVISVEPEPDDSPSPFAIKPLVDMEVMAVMAPATQAMDNASGNLPKGQVTLH